MFKNTVRLCVFTYAHIHVLNPGSHRIELSGIRESIVRLLVEFMYSGEIKITNSNILELMHAAEMLQIEVVAQFCSNYLLKHISPNNCNSILEFGKLFAKQELVEKCIEFMSLQFIEVMETEGQ